MHYFNYLFFFKTTMFQTLASLVIFKFRKLIEVSLMSDVNLIFEWTLFRLLRYKGVQLLSRMRPNQENVVKLILAYVSQNKFDRYFSSERHHIGFYRYSR